MDGLTTPYEDDSVTEFMECSVCEVSLRGLSLYKIHLTTPGHLKKEDAAVAAGHMVREQIIPKFNDILQYVDYLKLDEPVIGLSFLEEVLSVNAEHSNIGPRYTCTLCNITAHPPEIIHHVIGRKHRQKYIETKRPDLVSWDKQSVMMLTGKIIRTRAEIIARQDGSGRPKTMKNLGHIMTRVPSWQRHTENPQKPSGAHQRKQEFHASDHDRFRADPSSRAAFVPAEARPMNVAGRGQTTNPWNQQMAKANDWVRTSSQGKGLDLDYRLDDSSTGTKRVEPYRETERAWDQPAESYTNYKKQEANNGFFTEDGRRVFLLPGLDCQPPRQGYQPQRSEYQILRPDDQTQRPDYQTQRLDYQTQRLDLQTQGLDIQTQHPGLQTQGPDIQTQRPGYQTQRPDYQTQRLDFQSKSPGFQGDDLRWSSDKGRDVRVGTSVSEPPMRNVCLSSERPGERFRDYNHGMCQAESLPANPAGFQTPLEDSRSMSAIPEPFRRFLTGSAGDDASGRRKRKSRFSDATPEEVAVTNRMFNDRPPDVKLRCPLESSASGTSQQDTRRLMRHPNQFSQSQPNSPTLLQMSSQRSFRQEPNFRRSKDGYGEERNGGGRNWSNLCDGPHMYQQEVCREPSDLDGNLYEGFGQQQMYMTRHPDERAQCPERFQGDALQQQFQQRDLQPSSQGVFNSRSPPLDLESPIGMHRNPQYSKSLEKLKSTILEFMSRN
ncbi:uncharacterized protein si:ch211-13c6.2 isoform X2 [Syngnathus acus]|uniref:uncharacterized protein si:ch211-13c6.2 isoform X2 n=1 Tax=Syngnathus acus TaxID=161584 RepID=UPI001885F00D|nr:uncharacterized protein si:ch211-13c6.2 isoform X2 [Syngnathus acus]